MNIVSRILLREIVNIHRINLTTPEDVLAIYECHNGLEPRLCKKDEFILGVVVRWEAKQDHIDDDDVTFILKRWKYDKIGKPIVDAGIREMLNTGWMHNRLRMIVAMFLSKNLLIDWREGEKFFMEHLRGANGETYCSWDDRHEHPG